MLLKHQRTVILVTQKIHLVHSSDYVNILLVNGIVHCFFSLHLFVMKKKESFQGILTSFIFYFPFIESFAPIFFGIHQYAAVTIQ